MYRSPSVDAGTNEAMITHERKLVENRNVAKSQTPGSNDVVQLVEGACGVAPGPLPCFLLLEKGIPYPKGVDLTEVDNGLSSFVSSSISERSNAGVIRGAGSDMGVQVSKNDWS